MSRTKEQEHAYYQANKDKEKARQRAYYQANKEKKLKAHLEWQRNNRDKANANTVKSAAKKKAAKELDYILGLLPETKMQLRTKKKQEKEAKLELEYMLGMVDKLPVHMRLTPEVKKMRKEQTKLRNVGKPKTAKSQKQKDRARERKHERISTDPVYKLSRRIRAAIGLHLSKRGYTKSSRTAEILGCSYDEFKAHIESQFEPWMNWDNYGKYEIGQKQIGWDLDHILPLAAAITEQEIIEFNHYTNLRPLCSYENRVVKKDNLI